MYLPMLSKIQPEIIAQCQSAISSSQKFAEKWLQKYMLKNDPNQAKKVAEWLSGGVKYKSHGKVIDYAEAHDVLKLNVEKIPQNSKLWDCIWELYCRSILFLQFSGAGAAKLFESAKVSLTMNVQILRAPSPTQQPQPLPSHPMPPTRPLPIQPPAQPPDQPPPRPPAPTNT